MDSLPANSGSLSVFVNGGTTPLGRALVRLLATRGHKVTATVSSSHEAGELRGDGALPVYPSLTRTGELRSAMAAAKSTVVVNLAPTYPYQAPQLVRDWDAYTPVIAGGTMAALEAAKAVGAEFFVQGSFSFLGGDAHDHGDHEPAKTSFAEAAAQAEASVNQSGLVASILRYGFVYSADSPALLALRDALLRGRGVLAGSHHTRANWVHAIDGARATLLALDVRPSGETLDVVDDHPMTPAAFVDAFAAALGVTVPMQPPGFAQGLLAGATRQAMLAQPSGASNEQTKARLGWTLQYPTLASGIDQSLMVWRATEPIRA